MPHAAPFVRTAIAGVLLAASAGALAKGPATPAADTILTNGRIYTVDSKHPWAESVAIRDGRIVAVGTKAQVARLKNSATRMVDLGGRLVLPAFGDAHAHPLFGGLARSRCPLYEGKTLADYQALIAKCIERTPGDGPLYGVGWEDSLFPPNGVPRKEVLDAVSTTRALIFESVGGHSYWLNSKALELGKITKDTPNPTNGIIDRDPKTGEPVGGLQESATALVADLVPPPTEKEIQDSVIYVAEHFNSLGITSWNDAGVSFDDQGGAPMVDAYKAVADAGKLTARVAVSLKWQNERGMEQLPGLLKAAARANALGVSTHTVKFYVDGVIPQRTAYMLAPYEGSSERGASQIPAARLSEAVTAVESHGMSAFLHAIGDGAVHISLDAIEAAHKANGTRSTRDMVTHLNVVDPADQPRFGALGAFAQLQPTWSCWYPYMDLTETAIGAKRMASSYPAASILRAGGKIAYGADWPVDTANPLAGLEVAITRRTPGDANAKPLFTNEGVTLEQAIESHTLNVATVNGFDKVTGSIVAGKSADLVVLDRDIFKIPVTQIHETKVMLTLFEGRAVFGSLDGVAK